MGSGSWTVKMCAKYNGKPVLITRSGELYSGVCEVLGLGLGLTIFGRVPDVTLAPSQGLQPRHGPISSPGLQPHAAQGSPTCSTHTAAAPRQGSLACPMAWCGMAGHDIQRVGHQPAVLGLPSTQGSSCTWGGSRGHLGGTHGAHAGHKVAQAHDRCSSGEG